MTLFAAATKIAGPHIDWAALSPLMALAAGGIVVLLVGLFRPAVIRERVVPALTILTFLATLGLAIWRFHHPASIVSGALRIDDLALELDMVSCVAGLAALLLSWPGVAPRGSGQGAFPALTRSRDL